MGHRQSWRFEVGGTAEIDGTLIQGQTAKDYPEIQGIAV